MPGQSLTALQQNTKDYMVFDEFETMDTQSARQALKPSRLAWLENLQIIGPNFMEAVPGAVAALTSIAGKTVSEEFFANYNNTDYIISFNTDGSATQIQVSNGAQTVIAAAATFSATPDMSQWKSQGIVIADPTAGYCFWDGTNFAKAGTSSPNVNVVVGGLGYSPTPPTVTFTDLTGAGSGATGTVTVVGGIVTAVTMTNLGSGFKASSVIAARFAGGSTAGGGVTLAPILFGGTGYTSVPAVTFAAPLGGGVTATGTATISGGNVTGITITNAGSGYKENPVVTIAAPNVAGGLQAYANAQVANVAYATLQQWPIFSLTPTTLAVFQGRVWLGGGRNLTWTGTGGFDDSNPANASGTTAIPDADLVHQITALRSLNNYLYIFGDNSIKQIGTIQVSGSTTLFTIVSLSSDQGTTFPLTIQSYNRLVVFANKIGVHAIFGASVQKISDPMDGVFGHAGSSQPPTIDFSQPLVAAVNDVNSIRTYLLLVRYMDPILGLTRSLILAFYNNKWSTINMGSSLRAMCSAPIAGIYETFASSSNDITQILQDPTVAVAVLLRTALSHHGKKWMGKRALRYAVAHQANSIGQMNGSTDSENGSVTFDYQFSVAVIWVNNSGQIVQFVNSLNQPVNFVGAGFIFQRGQASASGIYLGLTLSGTFAKLAINSLFIEYQESTALASKGSA